MEAINSGYENLSLPSIAEQADHLFTAIDEKRQWLGRQIDVLASAIHPKTVFFPLKVVEKACRVFTSYLEDSGLSHVATSLSAQASKIHKIAAIPQIFFAITGLSGLLNLNKESFGLGVPHEHKHEEHHHEHHHLTPFEERHQKNIESVKFLKQVSNTFDFTSGLFNCGLGSVVRSAGFKVLAHTMHEFHEMLMLPRNLLAFAAHAAVAIKDVGMTLHAFAVESERNMDDIGQLSKDLKQLVWKDGVPLLRFGGALVRPALAVLCPGLKFAGSLVALGSFISVGMATIQIFSKDFQEEEAGSGCC